MEDKFFIKYKKILAIDEVGRGALAGPFFVGGLLSDIEFYSNLKLFNIKDSKKLKEKKRYEIFNSIKKIKPKFEIMKFTNKEIDKLGIGNCFKIAIENLYKKFKPDFILIDGKPVKCNIDKRKLKFIVDGDEKIKLISAISIIAKVLRDKYMISIDKYYPVYEFKINKGYGTKKHILAIKRFGICKHHRISFLKKLL